MSNNKVLITIPGRLHSAAVDRCVAGADEIVDDINFNPAKRQSEFNSDVTQELTGIHDVIDHPMYVGEDNYVYVWNTTTKSYTKTSRYVRGEGFKISKVFPSITAMQEYRGNDLKEGDFVIITSNVEDEDNAKLYTYSGTPGVYNFLVDMSGAIGFTGKTPQFIIGTITTVEPNVPASASLSHNGTDSDGNPKYKLSLAIPKGEKGTSDFVIVDDHSGAGDNPNKIYIPSANAEKENATAIAAEEARARAAEADRYTKSETYTKTEVNDLVDTPHQEYVTVDSYSNLPATGSKDTIYRVSNYNGSTSQADVSAYSEYAWNGSQYIFLCVKSQIGEVFDISVYKNNTKYADLAAALNGGTNIPQSLQKGGMSVKFVQSSDNKYVQYRLMSNTFNTTVANWQGVDDEPTAGSDNLVKSGGVHNGINAVSKAEELYNGIHFVGGGQQILYELGDFKAGAYFGIDISNIKRNGSYNIQLISLKTYKMFIGPYADTADAFLSTTLNSDVERLALAINVSQDNTYISGDIKVSRSLPKRELKTLTSGNEFSIEKGVFRCLYIEPTGIGNFKVSLYSSGSLISEYTFSSYRKSTQCISLDNCNHIRFINTGTNDAQFFYSLEESHKIKFLREDVDKLSMIDCYGMASPLYSSVVALPSSNTIATYQNMMAKTGGIIRSICIKPFNGGTFTFGLGAIDQRNWPIIRETFNVNIPSTDFQTIDLVSKEIKVKKGEYLFVYNEKNDRENIGFRANVDNIDICPNMLYGTDKGVNPFPKDGTTNFGAVLGLINWYIIPQNEGIENSEKDNEIELNRCITNASFGGTHIIRDNVGNAYKITKNNNNILLSEVKYKKVLILGNSLLTSLNGHGLCATISSNDFANILLKAFLLKDNTSTISRLNAASWERTLGVTQQDFETLFNGYTDNYDLVIIRIGENVNNVLSLRDSMDALIEYISTNYANADIVVTSTVLDYSNYNKNAALLESSLAHGIPFVNIDGSKDKYLIGIARMYTKGNVISPSDYAIQTHSNDLGFLHIANSILSTIGYNTLNISHNIVTNSSVEVDVPQLGVENGIVTIKTYGLSAPNIVVTDANNNSLPVTHYNLSDFEFDRRFPDGTEDTATFSSTFIMPSTDVNISVS